mmetsp:Transcript_55412/g.98692  ORF Transcript_55412/g.98692 Transcript_55412/m.98692 type:complete len:206 (-) Transcript_55412:257-874(-)
MKRGSWPGTVSTPSPPLWALVGCQSPLGRQWPMYFQALAQSCWTSTWSCGMRPPFLHPQRGSPRPGSQRPPWRLSCSGVCFLRCSGLQDRRSFSQTSLWTSGWRLASPLMTSQRWMACSVLAGIPLGSGRRLASRNPGLSSPLAMARPAWQSTVRASRWCRRCRSPARALAWTSWGRLSSWFRLRAPPLPFLLSGRCCSCASAPR